MHNCKWKNLSKIACLNINRRQTSSDKKHNLSLRLVLFFPFRCCLAGCLQFTSSTVKQRNYFKQAISKNPSRKTFLVECLRRDVASCKRLEKAGILARNSHISVASDWSALDPISRSPFLTSWNLHKVELFSAFKVQVSSIWKEKKIDIHDSTTRTLLEPTTQMVQYTTLTTRLLRICWIDVT